MIKPVNGLLSDQDRDTIEQHLEQADQLLPFLINLNSDERQTGVKLGERSHRFAQKIMRYVSKNPQLLPGFIDQNKLEERYQLWENLYSINVTTSQLAEGINDTLMAAGSELFDDLLTIYHQVKLANGYIPGIDTVHNDLAQRFERNGSMEVDEKGEGIRGNVDHDVDSNNSGGELDDDPEGPVAES